MMFTATRRHLLALGVIALLIVGVGLCPLDRGDGAGGDCCLYRLFPLDLSVPPPRA